MSDHPAVYLPAKIVDQDEDGYIYEAGARRHKRPFVSVEPVGSLTVRHDETEDERYMLSVHFEPMRSGGLIVWTDLPPGRYLIVPAPKGADDG